MSLVPQSQYRKPAPARIEQRGEMRHQVSLTRASVRGDAAPPETAWMVDISSLGCRLQVQNNYRTNSRIQIGVEGFMPVMATVVWQENDRVGCRFDKAISLAMFRALTIQVN